MDQEVPFSVLVESPARLTFGHCPKLLGHPLFELRWGCLFISAPGVVLCEIPRGRKQDREANVGG